MKIGITGHRQLNHSELTIKQALKKLYIENKADLVISGMALGFDTLAAEVALENNIPYIAAIPFVEQAKLWPKKDQEKYLFLLEYAKEIYIQPEAETGNRIFAGYFGRNRWIVTNTELLIAYIANYKDGGTADTWNYAEKLGRSRVNIIDHIIF